MVGGVVPDWLLDIEVYNDWGDEYWAQAPFLVHGIDDVLWTESVDAVLAYLREELERARKEE